MRTRNAKEQNGRQLPAHSNLGYKPVTTSSNQDSAEARFSLLIKEQKDLVIK